MNEEYILRSDGEFFNKQDEARNAIIKEQDKI